jgi:mannan endo-1,6-alpha-mannosidase
MTWTPRLVAALASFSLVAGLDLTVGDDASIKQAAAQIAKGLYVYHNESATTGGFEQPQPWFWWLSGNGWNGLLDYTVFTGDTTYQEDLLSALNKNVGEKYDFAPAAQASWEANDDQVYWVYNSLTAMEHNFEALPCAAAADGTCQNSWEAISVNAFNLFTSRWNADIGTCNGGLKWQYNPSVAGYYYKNSVTNGGFFQTAARLARYQPSNPDFASWANKIWDWSTSVGLVSADFHVSDGTSDQNGANCSTLNQDQWSYTIASYMHGAAHMYAASADGSAEKSAWESRVQGLVAAAKSTFFGPNSGNPNVMFEQKCELSKACTTDQTSFKSSLARWMAMTAVLVPSTSDAITELLEASAKGAVATCGENNACGSQWYVGEFNGQSDFGVQLSALEIVQGLLAKCAPALATAPAS